MTIGVRGERDLAAVSGIAAVAAVNVVCFSKVRDLLKLPIIHFENTCHRFAFRLLPFS